MDYILKVFTLTIPLTTKLTLQTSCNMVVMFPLLSTYSRVRFKSGFDISYYNFVFASLHLITGLSQDFEFPSTRRHGAKQHVNLFVHWCVWFHFTVKMPKFFGSSERTAKAEKKLQCFTKLISL